MKISNFKHMETTGTSPSGVLARARRALFTLFHGQWSMRKTGAAVKARRLAEKHMDLELALLQFVRDYGLNDQGFHALLQIMEEIHKISQENRKEREAKQPGPAPPEVKLCPGCSRRYYAERADPYYDIQKFTHRVPKKPGYYWWKDLENGCPQIVRFLPHGLMARAFHDREFVESRPYGLWGPEVKPWGLS